MLWVATQLVLKLYPVLWRLGHVSQKRTAGYMPDNGLISCMLVLSMNRHVCMKTYCC